MEQNHIEEVAQKLLEEKDADARTRVYEGAFTPLLTCLLVLWAFWQVWVNVRAVNAMTLRMGHCMFLLAFTFLIYPTVKKEKKRRKFPPLQDIALVALTLATFGYMILNYSKVAQSMGFFTKFQYVVAAVAIFLVFEAARRASTSLAILGLLFFLYNFFGRYIPGSLGHNGFSLRRVLSHLAWGSQGIFGVGIGVSASYIFLFVLFGAFLKYSGFSKFINDVSMTLVGRSPGGPAKVAVVASALIGMINGSAVANVVTTGTITIPLMKKTGYRSEFAAAVEAVASTGGQFCPPIMGAVGFVMAEFLGVSYSKVMMAAAIPAFLYYLSLMFAVHFEAKRLGLRGLSPENIPDALIVLKKQGHLVLPLVVLMGMMFLGYTPLYAAVYAIVATVLAAALRKETRMSRETIVKALEEGARGAVGVGVSCVVIGIIIGTVSLTSLGLSMGYVILSVVGKDQLYLGGLMVMIMSTILGMGVPGVAAYVIVVAVAIPVLIDIGVVPMAAHMFCLIYACLSNITPPVAMSSYVAAGLADSDQTKTSFIAMKLGLTGFLLPFFFLGNPVLLIGATPTGFLTTAQAAVTATIGVIGLTAALQGRLVTKLNRLERIGFFVAALCTISPEKLSDGAGILIIALLIGIQLYKHYKTGDEAQ
ncbi:MAG: TRAP transporter fused permease subunit [Fusobacteriaceae bacterium]|nr:TRAP transporter fused permease subunit [Fusobacteriaceae bacterium]